MTAPRIPPAKKKTAQERSSGGPPRTSRESSPAGPQAETVVLAVTGMSPAVLTETIWALATQRHPPVIPSRVIALTTRPGEQAIREQLLRPDASGVCIWEQLHDEVARKIGLPVTDRLKLEVKVFERYERGRAIALEKLETEEDHLAVGDCLLNALWELVAPDRGLRVIASIAGGFKSMSALLLSCVSLLGRHTDQITHVLVTEPYDQRLQPLFFFPEQSLQTLRSGATTVRAADARIHIAEVPFVALRTLFEKELVRKPRSYRELVERCRGNVAQQSRDSIHLVLHRTRPSFKVNGVEIQTSAKEQVLMLFLAERALGGEKALGSYAAAIDLLKGYSHRIYSQRSLDDFGDWRFDAQITDDDGQRFCTKQRSQLKEKLQKAGPAAAALDPFLPTRGRLSLDLPSANIKIMD